MTPQEAIEAAELVETETRYRQQIGRESYRAGFEAGYRAGVEKALNDREGEHDRWWRERGHRLVNQPSHAELEELRWGPGGREHFGDPRPGDFPGLQPRAEAEADNDEAELEMTA